MYKKILPLTMLLGASLKLWSASIDASVFVNSAVVAEDKEYFKSNKNHVELIYTQENIRFAQQTYDAENLLHDNYENLFDWKLDETLYVGLISSNNQIANGFSTQWPNNRQINYVGGALRVDYFCSTSWLHTLIYHETAHNYQMNMKANSVSQFLHDIFGNGLVILPVPMSVPNVTENSFMTEGNAVLNESWHGNGGRLYSGRFKAQTILQAEARKINPAEVYNTKLAFPYGEIAYIQGGFYNLYLAQKYGLKNTNHYFKYHSEDFLWSQFTNASMKEAVGVDFETSLYDFSQEYKNLATHFIKAEGEKIATSQFFNSLSSSDNEIYFLTNEDGVSKPELVIVNKQNSNIKKIKSSWIAGKVIKKDGEYFTQASAYVSPTKIYQGLFDNQGFIKPNTESKVIQAYLHDNREIYFDVASSFAQPQLYISNKFYAQVNSSVLVDKDDNLYYFVQNKKTRTLYKNKTALFSYKGFYGIVSDVDREGSVYFIANSTLGSTLYRFKDGDVSRASSADNIVEAKLINDKTVLLAAINDKEYYYVQNSLKNIKEVPFETKLFFENKEYYGDYHVENTMNPLDTKHSYNPLFDMHYSGSDVAVGVSADSEFVGSLNINFADPLLQNSLSMYLKHDESTISIAGAKYANSEYLLNYTLSAYGVVDKNGRQNVRDSGLMAAISLPLYRAGYYHVDIGASYFQDYDTLEREPISAVLSLKRAEQYGVSMYNNYLNALDVYAVTERSDKIYGALYRYTHDLGKEFYFAMEAKYSFSDSLIGTGSRGVKLSNVAYQLDLDPSVITMPSLEGSAYVKNAGYGEVNLAKVFNFSSYFFTFPLSLQRESLYLKYRYYDLESFSNGNFNANEITIGTTLSTVFLNSLELPIGFEYIHNDAIFLQDKSKFRLMLGYSF